MPAMLLLEKLVTGLAILFLGIIFPLEHQAIQIHFSEPIDGQLSIQPFLLYGNAIEHQQFSGCHGLSSYFGSCWINDSEIIFRYPDYFTKKITFQRYEPWHNRYVRRSISSKLSSYHWDFPPQYYFNERFISPKNGVYCGFVFFIDETTKSSIAFSQFFSGEFANGRVRRFALENPIDLPYKKLIKLEIEKIYIKAMITKE